MWRGNTPFQNVGGKLFHCLTGPFGGTNGHQVLVDLLPHFRGDHAGRETCHGNIMRRQIARARLSQRHHGPFTGTIGCHVTKALTAGNAGRVHDLAAGALRDHLARGFLHSDQAAQPVYGHDEIPVIFGHIQKVHRLVHAGIVEFHIQTAKAVHGMRNHGADLVAVGHIHGGVSDLLRPSLRRGRRLHRPLPAPLPR